MRMLIVLYVLLGCMVILAGWLFILSPGKIESYRTQNGNVLPGSISERAFVNIGGIRQGMFIRGRNIKNPVVLFLHGGPGMPTYFLAKNFPAGLEDSFTVCYWEQRGAGISYNPDMDAKSITVEQLVSDTIELTNYLCERFCKEKIYLVAHSWGSFFGIQAAAKAPELYYAYIGVSQTVNQRQSEIISYKWMLEQYASMGNAKMVKKIKDSAVFESDEALISYFRSPLRDQVMHILGIGTMRNMKDVVSGIFLPFLGTKEYTLGEKINTFFIAKPFLRNKTKLIDQLFSTDLATRVPILEIPVYFLSGSYDLTVNHNLNRAYFEQLQAPLKGYYTFSQSAHSPLHEEPAKFMDIMAIDVLGGKTTLADT